MAVENGALSPVSQQGQAAMSTPNDNTKPTCDQCHERETDDSLTLYSIAGKQFDKHFCSVECRDAWLVEHQDDPPPVNELVEKMNQIFDERLGGAS